MPPMAMGAITKNAGALVVAQGVRPRRNCVPPAPTQDAEVARLTRELASRGARSNLNTTPTSLATNLQRARPTLNREAAGAGLAHEFAVTRGTDNLPSTGEAPHVQCHTEGIF
jgi:hypothetical protein